MSGRLATQDSDARDATSPARARFAVRRLTLTDFRSYGALRLDLDPGMLVITGANGVGKTNLLEAVSLLVPGKGLRGARLGDLAKHAPGAAGTAPGAPRAAGWAVAARVDGPQGPSDVGTGWQGGAETDTEFENGGQAARRTVRIDGETQRGQSQLTGVMSAYWLTPQMDRLFQDGAGARRRFLDRMVFGWDPAHAGRVAAYEQAMRERARLLRGERTNNRQGDRAPDPGWLNALEETMATKGIAISVARQDVAGRLAHAAAEGWGPFPGAEVALIGDVETWLANGPALAAEDAFRAALAAARADDARSGRTSAGPQKSDLVVRHGPKGQDAALCSTGEQKALLIGLVLANARTRAAEDGGLPVLLLDEVAAHLDEHRRAALFEALDEIGGQVWMTGTEVDLFRPLQGAAQFLSVADGGAITLN